MFPTYSVDPTDSYCPLRALNLQHKFKVIMCDLHFSLRIFILYIYIYQRDLNRECSSNISHSIPNHNLMYLQKDKPCSKNNPCWLSFVKTNQFLLSITALSQPASQPGGSTIAQLYRQLKTNSFSKLHSFMKL